MGAWGFGPFDSDGALDWVGCLADNAGAVKLDDGNVDCSNIDETVVVTAVRAALSDKSAATSEWGWGTLDGAYAAAGLVALGLNGADFVPHGFSGYGYEGLLSRAKAKKLVPAATRSLKRMLNAAEKKNTPLSDIPELRDGMKNLLALLAELVEQEKQWVL